MGVDLTVGLDVHSARPQHTSQRRAMQDARALLKPGDQQDRAHGYASPRRKGALR